MVLCLPTWTISSNSSQFADMIQMIRTLPAVTFETLWTGQAQVSPSLEGANTWCENVGLTSVRLIAALITQNGCNDKGREANVHRQTSDTPPRWTVSLDSSCLARSASDGPLGEVLTG